jgi:hypothetical protein
MVKSSYQQKPKAMKRESKYQKRYRESRKVKGDTTEDIEQKDLELRTDCHEAEITMGTPIIA